MIDDAPGKIGLADRLDAFQPGRGLHLQHQWAAAGADQVDPGHTQPQRLGRAHRHLLLGAAGLGRAGTAAGMQVGAEIPVRGLALHGAHAVAEDELRAHVDVFVQRLSSYPDWPEIADIECVGCEVPDTDRPQSHGSPP